MCGIAGFIGKKYYNHSAVIKNMTALLARRGPDDEGFFVDSFQNDLKKDHIVLGHRRLKIIDLSQKAHQPMSNSSNTVSIAYNGEIYNYLEIKGELIEKGYNFYSSSDTEVVLKAYEVWGTGCFEKFNGMWAMVIYDKNRNKAILSRDRFGKKPLFYYKTSDEFIFASEIKAIISHPLVVKEPNYDKVFRYLAMNYRYVDFDNSSFFNNIEQVPRSSFMEIDGDLKTKTEAYWSLSSSGYERLNGISDAEAVDQFKDLFVDSVRLRMRSDVPVGCMLSGGMDSTSIACVAYKILNQPIATFSGITGDIKNVYDESEYIDSVIKEINADFHYIKPNPEDIFDTVDEMLSFHDEPICTVTWYNLYLIAKKIKESHIPVILNGHGGDESLAGYWYHYHYYFHDLEREGNLEALRNEQHAWIDNHHRNPKELPDMSGFVKKLYTRYAKETDRFPDYSGCFNEKIMTKYQSSRNVQLFRDFDQLLTRLLYSEIIYETIPVTLKPEDRNTMSQSIESRSPFLDYRLVEFCFSLPNKFKIRNGLGKWILREAMKGVLPEKVRTRKDKAGFVAPADVWFRTINKQQMIDLIGSGSLNKRGLLNIDRVKNIFLEHLSATKNHHMFLWQLVNMELWFRRFFDGKK